MNAKTIRNALGLLQDEPDSAQAWSDLRTALGVDPSGTPSGKRPDVGMPDEELWKLLEAARRAHEARREYEAVANLLELEAALARGSDAEADLLEVLARVLHEELLDDARYVRVNKRLLELKPGDMDIEGALEDSEAKRSKWPELVQRFVDEANKTGEASFKASLLVSAAETAYRYGRIEAEANAKGAKKKLASLLDEIIDRLEEANAIDPRNRRAVMLLERIYREQEKWEKLAEMLSRFAADSSIKEDKIAGLVRMARVFMRKIKSPERAAQAYEKVIDLSPGHPEATSALVDYFTQREDWDHLVALYDEQLKSAGARAGQDVGVVLQIAMVHWKMRGKPEAAEPYFERLRKSEPAHPGMLDFFREWCVKRGEQARLAQILTDAQRSLPDGPERAKLSAEIAQLAEEGANATKAIEQWRAILRQDANNKEAREALKRLYKHTGGWNALADLLRQDLERVGSDDKARLPILKEIAVIYREHIKSESALVTVLSQIIAIDPTEREALRELARVYEALSRWRDLLGTQMRLAELEEDANVRTELYRSVARRWLEQFSNVQNAVEAYEKIREIKPTDPEALEKLKELYAKRRAYKPLYDLFEAEASQLSAGAERRAIWLEMAKLAADRLEQGPQAVKLLKKVLEEDPSNTHALDMLEKHAEREKDYITVAEVLERRADVAQDDATRLAVLQKLGGIYSDRLHDHQGAMRTWSAVLELQPGNVKALRVLRDAHLAIADFDGLTKLYAASGDWEGLVEVLSNAADKASDTAVKIDLSYRVADVFREKLGAPERAFRAYERILGVRPDEERAARELARIYEKEEKWTRLPALYETLLGHAQGVDEKLAILAKLVDVTGSHLHDRAAAFGYARRAYELAPDREGAVDALERAARAAGDLAGFSDELAARIKQKKVKKEEKRALRGKLASVLATELGRVDEAIAAYKALVEEDEEDETSVLALDRILRQADRRDDLRWLFQLRVDRTPSAAQKVALYQEWAELEEEAFGSPDRAAKIYESILEISPQHGSALRAMARLLKQAGDVEGAARALERDRDQHQGAERVSRELDLARLYMTSLRKPNEALASVKRALELSPNDPAAIQVLEELLPIAETRAHAAVMLDAIYGETGNYRKQVDVLQVRIATAAAKGDRLELYGRLGDVYEKLGDYNAAFDVLARAVAELPAELAIWDKLAIFANRTQRTEQFVEALAQAVPPTGDTGLPAAVEADLAERIATLYDEMLGKIDEARPYLERILARDPGNERAFSRLKQILTTREKWDSLEDFYERAVRATNDGPRRADLLAEVALISEEITGNIPKAIGYYERILEIEPSHEQARRALEKLYATEQRWPALAKLLEKRLENATGDDATALRLRLGTLHFRELGDPKVALGFLEDVLNAETSNREAREIVEKCLDISELRHRAATILEAVYAARDEARDLVRVLEIRLETVTDEIEKRELLRRVAELRDERLSDDPGAFEAYAKLVPMMPGDSDARARLLEIAKRTEAQERAALVLTKAAEVADVPQPRAEILRDLAALYEEQLHDAVRAERIHRKVLELDPDDATLALPAARSLARIYTASGKDAELAEILKTQVKLEDDAQLRRELLGKLGDLCETKLEDRRGAIAAWKQRLDDDPADDAALEALDRLYERTQEWRSLVDVLRMRERNASDPEARKKIMTRLASTLAERVADVEEAILAYRALIDDFGAEHESLAALAKLYEVADRWSDLAETLEAKLALIDAPPDKLALLAKLGTVRLQRMHDTEAAIEAYRQALTIDPAHAQSRHALEALLVDTEARREAAAILRPLYEADADHTRLLRVLDIEADHAETIQERLAIFEQASSICEGPLGDAQRAFAYAGRGVREACEDAELPKWLVRAEKLTEKTGRFEDLVELLREVLPDIIDGDVQLEVTLKIATLARERLRDLELAKSYYLKALELRGDERRALLALESLYGELKDAPALLDILRRLAESAETDQERKEMLFKEAKLCDEIIADAGKAIEVYEDILDIDLDPAALSALERLYTNAGRFDDLVALYERELALDATSDERKAALHQRLGDVHEKRMKDVDRAFDEYEAALQLDPQHEATVGSLEGLMQDRAHAARAAEILEGVYLARLDWRRVMVALGVRLEQSEDPEEKRQLLRRLAKLHEEQEENYRAALETTAQLFAEDVTDESTWSELERLARVANAEARLAEIYAAELEKVSAEEAATAKLARRTAELFEAQRNIDRALVFYRRAYDFAPEEDTGAFEAIDRLLREASRPAERVALYKGRLEQQNDPKDQLTTLHTIATLQEAELHDDDAAIDTYRQALEVDDTDAHALESLTRLYARRERWQDLADLYRKRAEQSALPEDEAKYRLELGRVLEKNLGDVAGAIDEYQAVLEAGATPSQQAAVEQLEGLLGDPQHKARAVDLLRPVYESASDWRKLVQVNAERLSIATETSDKVAILRETAKLWEEQGSDPGKAFDALAEAFVLDPDDGESRAQLDRVAEITKRWDDLAEAYEKAIPKVQDFSQKELLGALARLHDKRRDDPRRALEAWERLFRLDETNPEPLEEMDMLATLLSDWAALVRVLAKRAELTPDDAERASTWRRIGEARRDMLDDTAGAIDAYERAFELESDSAYTIDHLIALYETKNDAARLVDLYRRRIELCGEGDQDLRYRLLLDAASRYETGIGDRREAIALLDDALAMRPGDVEVVRRLEGLYMAERMWPELLENLKQQAAAATSEEERRAVGKRIGNLLGKELEDHRAALEAFRGVLESEYDEEAARAMRELGETRDELRLDACAALDPVLRRAGKWEELTGVLELRLRGQSDAAERSATLVEQATLFEANIGDSSRALASLLRAMHETPDAARLHDHIERVAGQLGAEGWRKYADALADRVGTIFDAKVSAGLFVRLGKVAEERLSDDARAARAFSQALEQSGDDAAVLASLDRLYGRMGEWRALADVLERRIALEKEPEALAELLHRLGSLQVKELGERTQGMATLRQALEKLPTHGPTRAALLALLSEDGAFDDAFEALEAAYRRESESEELAKLYERRLDRAQTTRDRVRARLDLAKILEVNVGDAARAQAAVEAGLAEDPADGDTLAELERLAAGGRWESAASALEKALVSAKDLSSTTRSELWVRLADWRLEKMSDPAAAEKAFERAREHDPDNVEILRSLEQLRRGSGRERDLVVTLRARAKLETAVATRREILREAKEIAEHKLGDRVLAEATLRDLLAEGDNDRWALEELTRLREDAQDHAEVVELLLRQAEMATGQEALDLRYRAASVVGEKLGDDARAIKLLEEILEQEPSEVRAANALRALYEKNGRHKDLGKLLKSQIGVATSPADRCSLRLDLARLQRDKFGAASDALDTLRALLEEEPTRADAVLLLSQILDEMGKDEELAELLDSQIKHARDRGDAAAELSFQVRLGEVYEGKLKDAGRALRAYQGVLDREPTHQGALEAVARLAESRGEWAQASAALARLLESATGAAGGPPKQEAVKLAVRLAHAKEELKDLAGVEEALKRALELDARDADVRARLRTLYEKSEKWLELAGMLVGDAELVQAAHPEETRPSPQETTTEKGGSVPPPVGPRAEMIALLRRAADIHLNKRKEPADAVPLLERAASLSPHDRELLVLLCDAYTASNRERDAAKVLEQVIASFGNKRTKELSVYHHRLGVALKQLGDKDVALTQLDMAFRIDPGSVPVLKELGVLALESNDLDRAQKTFRALLLQKLDDKSGISKGEVFCYLGEISARQGDKVKAIQMFERAIENEPSLVRAKTKLQELKG